MYVSVAPWALGFPIPDMFTPPPAGLQPQIVVFDIAKVRLIQSVS